MPLEFFARNSPPLDFSRVPITVILISIIVIMIIVIM